MRRWTRRFPGGLVVVKWWLLAPPHYLVLSVVVGGGLWASSRRTAHGGLSAGGLLGLLVLISALVLLFTARYPKPLYDLVVGIDRSSRAAACAALMTDAYPPFRLGQGGPDPARSRSPYPERPARPRAVIPPTPGNSAGFTTRRPA